VINNVTTRYGWSLALAAAVALSPSLAEAQFPGGDRDGGTHALTILGMPVSPRAAALGEAMSTVTEDPAAIWYNAAGLARLRTNAFIVTGQQRFAQTQLVGAAVAFPTDIVSFGIGVRAFNGGTVENRVAGELVGGNERAFQYVLEGGGALQMARWWRWGGTLYFAQEVLGDQSQGAVGINSGMQMDLRSRLMIAFGVRNIGTKVRFEEGRSVPAGEEGGDPDTDANGGEQSFHHPRMAYVGAGLDLMRKRNLIQTPLLFRGQALVFDARAVADVRAVQDQELNAGIGIEGTANGVAIGRIGYQFGDDNRKGLSLGAGVNVGQFRLEYAFRNYTNGGAGFFTNDPIGDSHNVAATYFWGTREQNVPVVPVIVTQPVDTALINEAVRQAIAAEMDRLRPLLDSLRMQRVEIQRDTTSLISRYIVPVHFGFDSSVVREADFTVLSQVAEVIRQVYPTALVTIEGFADPAGSVQYNIGLSRRRAEAVRDIMVSRFGLPAQQFRAIPYGEQTARLVTPGARGDDPGAEANRRVVFTIDATRRF
jgi:outer membrane protein OmpA-like peptidoglycan-associated protein